MVGLLPPRSGIAALVLVVDEFALSRGYIAFGGGYTGWMDALMAVAVFLAPVGVYNLLSRQRLFRPPNPDRPVAG